MRPVGTAEELERRRRRAVALIEQGESPTVIARMLGVARGSLYRWKHAADQAADGLAAKPHPGRTRRMTESQQQQLAHLLLQDATAHGWSNAQWTAQRVATMMRRHFAVRYHVEHARKVLKQRLGWSSQQPQRRARERDEAAIARWRRSKFPHIKKRRATRRQSGISR